MSVDNYMHRLHGRPLIAKNCKENPGGGRERKCIHDRVCRDCSRCNPESSYKKYKGYAKKRKLSFELTLEEFKTIVSSPCSYCGESKEPIGVDRIHSDYGYSFSNCQALCIMCNRMKLNYSEERFYAHLIRIFRHSLRKFLTSVDN